MQRVLGANSNTTIDTAWGTDADHAYSDTTRNHGAVTGQTGNGWWTDSGGHRFDLTYSYHSDGLDTTATLYSVQTHDDRQEWDDGEVTYFRHNEHDWYHVERGGTTVYEGVTTVIDETGDQDIQVHQVVSDGELQEYTYDTSGTSLRHIRQDFPDQGLTHFQTVDQRDYRHAALNDPLFTVHKWGSLTITNSWSPAPPSGAEGNSSTPYDDTFQSASPDGGPINPPSEGGHGVGQPGFWEGLIPIWGSARAALDDFQNGRYLSGALNTAFAVSDVFLVKAVVTSAVKGAVKVGGKVLGKRAIAESGTAAEKVAEQACKVPGKGCFLPDTLVATEGGLRPIGSIRVSDRVWAFDLVAGEWKLRHVLKTFEEQYAGDLVHVAVGEDVIRATSAHPFWVVEGPELSTRPSAPHNAEIPWNVSIAGRWVNAAHLRVGDVLLLKSGQSARVQRLVVVPVCTMVCNFHVEELQCYAVGAGQVLVHNNYTGQASKIDRAAFKAEREAFWKAEAKNNASKYSAEDLTRMKNGRPPIGPDGFPMELHHVDRTSHGGTTPMTRTAHRLGGNYKLNHP